MWGLGGLGGLGFRGFRVWSGFGIALKGSGST